MVTEPAIDWDRSEILSGARNHFVCTTSMPFDVLQFSGHDALDLLHRLSTNAIVDMRIGEARETILTTEKGRIVDLILLSLFHDGLFALCSAGRGRAVVEWVKKFIITDDVTVEPPIPWNTITCLFGPHSISTINDAFGISLVRNGCAVDARRDMRLISVENARGTRVVILGASGAPASILHEIDADPVSSEQTELLRILLGMPRGPNELNDQFNPYDVGLQDLISFTKGCYVGQEVIARIDSYNKVRRGLVGVELLDGHIVLQPAAITDEGGEIGRLTSSATDNGLTRSFGLGVVNLEGVSAGHPVNVLSDRAVVPGRIVKLPADLRQS